MIWIQPLPLRQQAEIGLTALTQHCMRAVQQSGPYGRRETARRASEAAARAAYAKWLPLMAFARKLTLTPSRLASADADAVFAAGWDERTLNDVVNVVCLFNFMNRFAEGHGIKGDERIFSDRGQALMEGGYDPEALGRSVVAHLRVLAEDAPE